MDVEHAGDCSITGTVVGFVYANAAAGHRPVASSELIIKELILIDAIVCGAAGGIAP